MLGQIKEARETLTKAIRLDPRLQAAYHNRARLALRQHFPSLDRFRFLSAFGQALPVPLQVTLKDAPGDAKRSLAILQREVLPDFRKALVSGPENRELPLDSSTANAVA